MIHTYKKILLTVCLFVLMFSCRQGESIINEGSETAVIKTDSEIAKIVEQIANKDGSADNILDKANCLTVVLPVEVIVNNAELLLIENKDDFEDIEDIFNESDSDTDTVKLLFPVDVIQKDYTTVTLNSQAELDELRKTCNGENEQDDDIECVDFEYPIQFSLFDKVSERSSKKTINNDEEMHSFIANLKESIVADFVYPVKVIAKNGDKKDLATADELKTFVNSVGSCDEDDDYDFEDDNCEDCDADKLKEFLTKCEDWKTSKLSLNLIIIGIYTNYEFEFDSDGDLEVEGGGNDHDGTWSTSGSGKNTKLTINLPTLTDFNGEWTVFKMRKRGDGTYVLDLRKGQDKLRFISDCD